MITYYLMILWLVVTCISCTKLIYGVYQDGRTHLKKDSLILTGVLLQFSWIMLWIGFKELNHYLVSLQAMLLAGFGLVGLALITIAIKKAN